MALRLLRRFRDAWARLRAWRRIRFTLGGLVFTAGAFAIGFAAMNTGNNLLFLLLGAMLGFIAVSGWLSEQAIRGLAVERHLPRAVTVGQEMRIGYTVTRREGRLPSLALEISEEGLPGTAFVAHVPPGESATARAINRFVRRGVYRLGTVTLSTAFPFGMFRKARDVQIPGEVIVWPRSDRPVRSPATGGGRKPKSGEHARGSVGHRGEYRSLRAYRAGDDPRDIHWRSSARLQAPVLREYDRDGAETRWICLDLRGPTDSEEGEAAVEVTASLAAGAMAENRPFAVVAGPVTVSPGHGAGQMERVLDALARADFFPDAPFPEPPVDPASCVLVTLAGASGFGDTLLVVGDAPPGVGSSAAP
jgi:uncharacterized protein (DUF58 family)